MEKIIAEHGDEIRHIINTSKNLRVASARIHRRICALRLREFKNSLKSVILKHNKLYII